jgi:hypothetical protein
LVKMFRGRKIFVVALNRLSDFTNIRKKLQFAIVFLFNIS